MRRRLAPALAVLAVVVAPLSTADAKKCEKDMLEVKVRCEMSPEDAGKTLIVPYMTTYYWTDPDNGKRKDDYTKPEMHQTSVCLGTESSTIPFKLKDQACDAKDVVASVYFCRLTKEEYERAGKPSNLVELCKKLDKPKLYIPGYPFGRNKEATHVINFRTTSVSVDPLKK